MNQNVPVSYPVFLSYCLLFTLAIRIIKELNAVWKCYFKNSPNVSLRTLKSLSVALIALITVCILAAKRSLLMLSISIIFQFIQSLHGVPDSAKWVFTKVCIFSSKFPLFVNIFLEHITARGCSLEKHKEVVWLKKVLILEDTHLICTTQSVEASY